MVAAGRILRLEEAVSQLWMLSCPLCADEQLARRRATEVALTLAAGAIRCRRCGAGYFAALISGPATLGAAAPELARLARL